MKEIQLDNLIFIRLILPIIDIIDDYPRLKKETDEFISLKKSDNYISDLHGYFNTSKKKFLSKRTEEFYNKNKESIDTINNICDIWNFVFAYKNDEGVKELLDSYYNYFIKHKDKLKDIRNLLYRLLELNISKISLVEHLNFSNKVFDRSTSIHIDRDMYYLDNMVIIPNYFNDTIKYKTIDSPYLIKTSFVGNEISKYGNEIIVNSLLFDINRLPRELTKECIFDFLLKLKQDKKETIDVLHNAVDLNTEVYDLNDHQKYLINLINRVKDTNTKQELLLILKELNLMIKKLSLLGEKYDDILLQMDDIISEKDLSDEKKYYKLVRDNMKYDID
jgi:hypothetical protein